MKTLISLWLCLVLSGTASADGVPSFGPLSDAAFYRLATCGGAPGQPCLGPAIRWPTSKLQVYLANFPEGFPEKIKSRIPDALDQAIARINAVGADIHLSRTRRASDAQIIVRPTRLREGDVTRGVPGIPDGETIGAGYVTVWWNQNKHITQATILLSASLLPYDVQSIVLEELFQSLGFRYDIDNRYYNARSILAERTNVVTAIKGQDAMTLRRHYPPN